MMHVYNLSEIFHHFMLDVKYVTESTKKNHTKKNLPKRLLGLHAYRQAP